MANQVNIVVKAKDEATKTFEGIGKGAALALGGIGAAAIGVGVAAFKMGDDIQKATNGLEVGLGITTAEAERLADVASNVYGNNFASSVEEAAGTITTAYQQMGDVGDAALQRVAENAHRLSDVFGVETTEGISAAKSLMENFGLSSDEAFDMIAHGFQQGMDRSGDFLDSINEYSTQFANGGASASQFFSTMQSGMQGGVLGTDKAADAFKEFSVRILDGSDATSEALKQIGLDADEFTRKIATGEMSTADAFDRVISNLGTVEDKAVLMQAGVGLLGTQFEDLGADGALALDMWSFSMSDTQGAMDGLDAKYRTLGDTIEQWKRKAMLALVPVADKMNEFIVEYGPKIGAAFEAVGEKIGGLAETYGPKLQAFFETVAGHVETFAGVIDEKLMPPLNRFIDWFKNNESAMQAAAVGIGTVLVVAFGALAVSAGAAAIGVIAATAPMIAITAAVAGLGAGIFLLVKHWDEITEKVPALGVATDGVKEIFDVFSGFVTDTLVPAIQDFAGFITDTVVPALQTLWGVFNDKILPVIGDLIKLYLLPLELAFKAAKVAVTDVLVPGLDVLWGFITNKVLPIIGTLINLYLTPLKVAFEVAKTAITDVLVPGMETLAGFITDTVMPTLNDIITKLEGPFDTAVGIGTTAIGLFYDGFKNVRDGIQWVIDKITALVDKILSIPEPPGWVMKGIDVVTGVATGGGNLNPVNWRANGGPASGWTVVGEQGPELLRLPGGSHVFSNSQSRQMAGSGGGVTVNVYATGYVQDVDALAFDVQRALERTL